MRIWGSNYTKFSFYHHIPGPGEEDDKPSDIVFSFPGGGRDEKVIYPVKYSIDDEKLERLIGAPIRDALEHIGGEVVKYNGLFLLVKFKDDKYFVLSNEDFDEYDLGMFKETIAASCDNKSFQDRYIYKVYPTQAGSKTTYRLYDIENKEVYPIDFKKRPESMLGVLEGCPALVKEGTESGYVQFGVSRKLVAQRWLANLVILMSDLSGINLDYRRVMKKYERQTFQTLNDDQKKEVQNAKNEMVVSIRTLRREFAQGAKWLDVPFSSNLLAIPQKGASYFVYKIEKHFNFLNELFDLRLLFDNHFQLSCRKIADLLGCKKCDLNTLINKAKEILDLVKTNATA